VRRRDFIKVIAASAAAWPIASRAQQQMMPVIGLLQASTPSAYASSVAAFRKALANEGFIEGRNVAIEYRWAEDRYSQLSALAEDLVARRVSVIATPGSTPATLAAKGATRTIPIVFFVGGDPVDLGLISSLARPGGNLTGVTNLSAEVGPKRLELLRQVLPSADSMALLVNPTSVVQTDVQTRELQAAARQLGFTLHIVRASTADEIVAGFETLAKLRTGGLVIGPDVFFNSRAEQIAGLALHHRMPTIYQYREFAAAGGLMSYGTNLAEMYRLSAVYTARVLKGEMPATMPVQQATSVELVINSKTAKALNVTIPLALLGRADEVIE
jgi:ABC-type uncharacterized transport system substrate-binding protein